MTYATETDLIDRFSAVEVSALAAGGVVAKALVDAEAEVNSYVAVRYTLPLPSTPVLLTTAVCDIARFRLYNDRATDEVKYRYERQVKWLEHLAAGKVLLDFGAPLTEAQLEDTRPVAPVAAYAPGSAFDDATLGKMPNMANSGW